MTEEVAKIITHIGTGGTLTRQEQLILADAVVDAAKVTSFAKAAADYIDQQNVVPDTRSDEALAAWVDEHDRLEEIAETKLDEWRSK